MTQSSPGWLLLVSVIANSTSSSTEKQQLYFTHSSTCHPHPLHANTGCDVIGVSLHISWNWIDELMPSVWSGICCTVRCTSPLAGHADPQIKVRCFIRKPESAAPNCGWGFITYLPSQPSNKQTNKQTDVKLQWWYTPHAKFHLVSTSTAILTDTQNERRG